MISTKENFTIFASRYVPFGAYFAAAFVAFRRDG